MKGEQQHITLCKSNESMNGRGLLTMILEPLNQQKYMISELFWVYVGYYVLNKILFLTVYISSFIFL